MGLEPAPDAGGDEIELPPVALDPPGLDLGLGQGLTEEEAPASDEIALDIPALTIDGDEEDTQISGLDMTSDLDDSDASAPDETKASIPKIQHETSGPTGPGGVAIPMAAPAAVAPADGSGEAETSIDGLVLEQDFEDQELGQKPEHWTGTDKDCATFEIVESTSKDGASKCLRLVKSAGADSVHYSRRFPETSGIVTVEFDICCPEKNKYLLGLYLEKDGNYNQAVRTVVHCLDPESASLRMQNEPAPYNMGDWRHVRYIINLPEGLIDGFVDADQILDQQVFVNKPPYINTLSIRDNHATTGVLMIDNIQISRKG